MLQALPFSDLMSQQIWVDFKRRWVKNSGIQSYLSAAGKNYAKKSLSWGFQAITDIWLPIYSSISLNATLCSKILWSISMSNSVLYQASIHFSEVADSLACSCKHPTKYEPITDHYPASLAFFSNQLWGELMSSHLKKQARQNASFQGTHPKHEKWMRWKIIDQINQNCVHG